jgi:sigma-B regulation protein RsbU (phosphoserine phosphatase)
MSENQNKRSILAVDDTPENLDVVKGILSPDYTVKAATSGKMALKIAETQSPDLILLDIMMPEMDGYEVCQRLKSNPKTSEIPIIFLTAKDQTMDEAKGFELGAEDYILKPVNPPILKARVKTHVALKQSRDALQAAYGIIKGQKDRMEEELNVGREIQMSMIPLKFPPFPDHDEFSIFAALEPAREVSGDFYDFYFLDEERLCICIGDVSGKGVPAALFMAMAKTLIKSRAYDDRSTASILTHVNDELSIDNKSSMFVTIFTAIINIKTGELVFTNAGHDPPYIKRSDGTLQRLSQRHGLVIGALEGMVYKEDRDSMSPGDLLVLYTDGVTEAMDVEDRLFSEDRYAETLGRTKADDPESIVRDTLAAIEAFTGGAEQSDDITILAVQFHGTTEDRPVGEQQIVVKNKFPEMIAVNEKFGTFADDCDIPPSVALKFNVIFDELLSNIISYAYTDDDEHDIEVRMERVGKRLTVTITDDGVPFNPLMVGKPDTELSLEDREIGGLGIHLVRNLVDDACYQRRIGKNVMTMILNLEREVGAP